jgi:hypothetical protein
LMVAQMMEHADRQDDAPPVSGSRVRAESLVMRAPIEHDDVDDFDMDFACDDIRPILAPAPQAIAPVLAMPTVDVAAPVAAASIVTAPAPPRMGAALLVVVTAVVAAQFVSVIASAAHFFFR